MAQGEINIDDLKPQIPKETQKELEALRESLRRLQGDRKYQVAVPSGGNVIKFAVVSDVHTGSNYERFDALEVFYEKLKREDVRIVLMPGDILDGHGMYKGQEFEQYAHGFDKQIEALIKKHPNTLNFDVTFITGNHDDSFYKENGVDPGPVIADAMGWHYAGREMAIIDLKTTDGFKLTVGMYHPGSGSAYAISYRSQKLVENIPGGKKPNIVLIGHFHKMEILPRYRNVYIAQAGTFQSQTPFMARKALDAHVGGCIIEATLNDKKALTSSIKAEFVSFYEPEDK